MFKKKKKEIPSIEELESEIKRVKYKYKYNSILRSTVYILITVAAFSVLLAVLFFPVLQISGTSMTPSLNDGEVVVCLKTNNIKSGDIIAFYYNNKILVKRVIGVSGDWIDIKEDGTVYRNKQELIEPYISAKSIGDLNIKLPYQVPDTRYFVMGDHRDISIDSRNTIVGCISEEQVVGKLFLKVYPFENFGKITSIVEE